MNKEEILCVAMSAFQRFTEVWDMTPSGAGVACNVFRAKLDAVMEETIEPPAALWGYVAQQFDSGYRCDHTLRHTREWIRKNAPEDEAGMITWLVKHGGHCDCEVLMNASKYLIVRGQGNGQVTTTKRCSW